MNLNWFKKIFKKKSENLDPNYIIRDLLFDREYNKTTKKFEYIREIQEEKIIIHINSNTVGRDWQVLVENENGTIGVCDVQTRNQLKSFLEILDIKI